MLSKDKVMQDLKSVLVARVDPGKSYNSVGQRQNLGEGLMAPAGSQNLNYDIYGRPASQNTLTGVGPDSTAVFTDNGAVPQYTAYNTSRMIQIESNNRPYIPTAAAGMRGASDFMGVGRHQMPQNLYMTGHRGDFVRQTSIPNDSLPEAHPPLASLHPPMRVPKFPIYDYSHSSAEITSYYPR